MSRHGVHHSSLADSTRGVYYRASMGLPHLPRSATHDAVIRRAGLVYKTWGSILEKEQRQHRIYSAWHAYTAELTWSTWCGIERVEVEFRSRGPCDQIVKITFVCTLVANHSSHIVSSSDSIFGLASYKVLILSTFSTHQMRLSSKIRFSKT